MLRKQYGRKKYVMLSPEALKKLDYPQLISMYLGAQGDMTLVPGDSKRRTDTPLVRACFIEICSRVKITPFVKGRSKH
jgi:hypothetical protein